MMYGRLLSPVNEDRENRMMMSPDGASSSPIAEMSPRPSAYYQRERAVIAPRSADGFGPEDMLFGTSEQMMEGGCRPMATGPSTLSPDGMMLMDSDSLPGSLEGSLTKGQSQRARPFTLHHSDPPSSDAMEMSPVPAVEPMQDAFFPASNTQADLAKGYFVACAGAFARD